MLQRLFVCIEHVEDAPLVGHWGAINDFVDTSLQGPPQGPPLATIYDCAGSC